VARNLTTSKQARVGHPADFFPLRDEHIDVVANGILAEHILLDNLRLAVSSYFLYVTYRTKGAWTAIRIPGARFFF